MSENVPKCASFYADNYRSTDMIYYILIDLNILIERIGWIIIFTNVSICHISQRRLPLFSIFWEFYCKRLRAFHKQTLELSRNRVH